MSVITLIWWVAVNIYLVGVIASACCYILYTAVCYRSLGWFPFDEEDLKESIVEILTWPYQFYKACWK